MKRETNFEKLFTKELKKLHYKDCLAICFMMDELIKIRDEYNPFSNYRTAYGVAQLEFNEFEEAIRKHYPDDKILDESKQVCQIMLRVISDLCLNDRETFDLLVNSLMDKYLNNDEKAK